MNILDLNHLNTCKFLLVYIIFRKIVYNKNDFIIKILKNIKIYILYKLIRKLTELAFEKVTGYDFGARAKVNNELYGSI